MATLFDVLVLGGIGLCGWFGFQRGLIPAVWVAIQVFLSVSLGLLIGESLSSLISDGLRFALEPTLPQGFPFEAWSVFLAFMTASWAPLAAFRWLLPGPDVSDEELSLAERAGGGLAGILGGTVFAGGVLVSLSMQPLIAAIRPPANAMYCDAGRLVIGTAGQFAGESHDGWSLVAFGEPTADRSVVTAKITSEPWHDPDFNSRHDEGETFADVDGDGIFTKDLRYVDADNSGSRRLGLYDKYRAGRWDFSLKSDNRDRNPVATAATGETGDGESATGEAVGTPAADEDTPPATPATDEGEDISPRPTVTETSPTTTETTPAKDPLDDF